MGLDPVLGDTEGLEPGQTQAGPQLPAVTGAQTDGVSRCCGEWEAQRRQGPSLGAEKASGRRKEVTGSSRIRGNKRHSPGKRRQRSWGRGSER